MIVLILAAGRGTRLNSSIHKTLQKVGSRPMIRNLYRNLQGLDISKIYIIVGHQKEQLLEEFKEEYEKKLVDFVEQKELLGTGHAILMAYDKIKSENEDVLILNGDLALIRKENIQKLIETFNSKPNTALTILTINLENPFSYGRIIKENDNVVGIKEQLDLTKEEESIKEVNTGVYLYKYSDLINTITKIDNNNSKKEYYLTDTIEMLSKSNKLITSCIIEDSNDTKGVNTSFELYEANRIYYLRNAKKHMLNGVRIYNLDNVYIDDDVTIGSDTIIHSGVHLINGTIIGSKCEIYQNSYIKNSLIKDNVVIKSSYVENSVIESNVTVGPYANIRPNTTLQENSKVGNFVEIKGSNIGNSTKVNHLTYIGDTKIGNHTNVGAGTITCNYDGNKKNKTEIGSNCFVGSNTTLIAPLEIGDNSLIAAGSVITKKVNKNTLAFGRSRQVNKENYYNEVEDGK